MVLGAVAARIYVPTMQVVTGHVTYRTQSAVAFERGDRLRRIAVEFDEPVRAGDLLAELHNGDLDAGEPVIVR